MKKTTSQIALVGYFQQFIKACACGKRLSQSFKKITTGTIVNYSYVELLLIEFEAMQKEPLRIQLLHRASMRALQKEKNYWAKFHFQFSNFMYKTKGYSDSYVNNVFKTIKAFFNYLQNEKGYSVGNYHKSFRAPSQKAAPVVLKPEQLQYLICDKAFEASLNSYFRRTKDIFVFGCTVGLRVSDLMRLEKKNLIYSGNEVYLKSYTQKTGAEVQIPLPEYAIDIIERYKRKAGKYILPRLAVSNLNKMVKKLIAKAGWDYELIKVISKQGKFVETKNANGKSWRFYQHITAHTMRRTAITTLLIMGVPELVVRKISGHAQGSKEFYRYISIAQDYMSNEVKNAYKKLLSAEYATSAT